MTGWMLYCREDAEKNRAYIQWFQAEGKLLGMMIELKMLEDLDGLKELALPDFVLNRSRNTEIAEKLEALGVRCINSSFVTKIANDKAETYRFFPQHGIPMLWTCATFVDSNLPNQTSCGYPLVAKSVDGHGGSEVFFVEDSKSWKQVLNALFGRKIVMQKLCAQPGRDLRIFVLGGEIIAAVLRESNCDFRANYSLGGKIRLAELTESQKQIVNEICRVFPMEWGGIDFLFDSEEVFYLNEVEDAVGSRSLSQLTDLNIARMVLTYIQRSQEV